MAPISKASLGPHGEHLLADANGNVPGPGDGPDALDWSNHPQGLHPGHAEDPEPTLVYDRIRDVIGAQEGWAGHPVRYADWDHYHRTVQTAAARAANASKLVAEDAAAKAAQAEAEAERQEAARAQARAILGEPATGA